MNPATLRPASADDIPAIQAIYAHHVLHGTGTFETEPPDVVEMQRRFATITGRGYPYLVAEYDGAVAGFAYLGPFRERHAYRFTVEDSIYLHPEFLRRGIGRQLLDRLITLATAAGFKQLLALVGDSTNHASVRLHESAGFTHAGTMKDVGHKFDRWLDVVILQRPLGDRA